jgi:hypothetical protein
LVLATASICSVATETHTQLTFFSIHPLRKGNLLSLAKDLICYLDFEGSLCSRSAGACAARRVVFLFLQK